MNQQLNQQCDRWHNNVLCYQPQRNQIQEKSSTYLDLNPKLESKSSNNLAQIAQDLAVKNQELTKANKQLANFAHTVSHDLQEPLRSINLFTQLLEEEYTEKLDGQAQEYMNFITSSASRMQTLIRDVLAYSGATTADGTWIEVDLNKLIQTVIIDLQAIIQETSAEIIVDNLPTAIVNPTEISQLLRNLITNSIKFRSDRKPLIKIASRVKNDRWLITVKDNGIGIAVEDREQIFQAFSRVHSQDRYPGNGIGLAICQKIVERYQGTIGVKSQLGKGSTFYFTLPR